MNSTQAIWFRGDLRTLDNPAVSGAIFSAEADQNSIPALYLVTPEQWRRHHWAPIKIDLLWRHLETFREELAAKGIQLNVRCCETYQDVPAAVLEFCNQHSVDVMHFNHEYPLDEVRRDRATQSWLKQHDISLQGHHGLLIAPPHAIKNQQGGYYKVFTAFNKAWRQHVAKSFSSQPTMVRWKSQQRVLALPNCPLERKDSSFWPAGEEHVLAKLQRYCDGDLANYQEERDFPALDRTSRLSPYWELGVLSPLTAARRLATRSPGFPHELDKGADVWLNELAWREFYQHLMFHEPRLSRGQAFLRYTDAFPWRDAENDFKAWCKGITGYPIVDAGMRQLASEGFMHNRLRMIVASFLVKDLRIDWRRGETFFMQHLIDGSFPANNGGWQWSASTGTDAAPYFRIFNPIRQSERFDPDGSYIRKWVKELADVPTRFIHWPHDWLEKNSSAEYAKPIVDHAIAKDDFLMKFKQVKS